MHEVVISGVGMWVPPETISNDELVKSFNQFIDSKKNSDSNLSYSDSNFIVKASGIKSRHVINKEGILNPSIMMPRLTPRKNEEYSYQCEMSLHAAKVALEKAKKSAKDIEAIIVSCSNFERPYPAIAIEVQKALGSLGFAFDLNVACSSATFAIHVAADMIKAGSIKNALLINPEICTAHLDFTDRDSHFIFGDACTATVVEKKETCQGSFPYRILGTKLQTQFSNNIRNNFGFLNRTDPQTQCTADKLFKQNGRKVFKEVIPWVAQHALSHMHSMSITKEQIKRLWLHQANESMNVLIAEKILGREATINELPLTLREYANTSSAGSIMAFNLHHEDLKDGERGIICSFGAGYSVGSIIVQKLGA